MISSNALVLVLGSGVVWASVLGYLVGRLEHRLTTALNEIRTVRAEQARATAEAKQPEPVKPQVTAGVYIPPEFTQRSNPRKAGLVEAKTPQQLEWAAKEEMDKLERGEV